MSVYQEVQQQVEAYPLGMVFTTSAFLSLGSRAAVDKALARLVEASKIVRMARGVFARAKRNTWVGEVLPEVVSVVEAIARQNGETIQVHGAEAVHRLGISTQMPIRRVFYTNGCSRTITIGKHRVEFQHTSNQKKLQHAGTKVGLALSALWYLGKEEVTTNVVARIRAVLSEEEFELLLNSMLPAWMRQVLVMNKEICH